MESELENGLLEDRQALEHANNKLKALNKKLEETISNKMQYEENLNMAMWTKDKAKEDEQRQKIDDAITEIESLKKEIERKEKDIEVFEIILSMTEKKAKEERVERTETNVERQEASPVKAKKYTSKPSMKIKIKALFLAIAKTKEEFMSKHSKRKEKYVPQHIKEKTQSDKKPNKIKSLLNKPKKIVSKLFTAKGMKRKMQALALAGIMAISHSASTVKNTMQSVENSDNKNSIEQFTDKKSKNIETVERKIKDRSQNIFAELMDGEKIELNIDKETEFQNEEVKEEEKIEVPKEEISNESDSKVDEEITVDYKPSDVFIPNKPEDEIKTIYGGEISASENGIRTEADILFAATQMGWRKEIIDNIKEMMPGLLAMQKDFDIDPLCALAIFQWESNCGTAYEPGGLAYERENDFRLANTMQYRGQKGVMGLSKLGYTYYDGWSTAAYEFGNYVRNAEHYAKSEKGAQTMADLEEFNGLSIFRNAGTVDAVTYNQLKACLEKKVTLSDISNATRALRASEIKEMTDTITSSVNKQKSVSKAMSGR